MRIRTGEHRDKMPSDSSGYWNIHSHNFFRKMNIALADLEFQMKKYHDASSNSWVIIQGILCVLQHSRSDRLPNSPPDEATWRRRSLIVLLTSWLTSSLTITKSFSTQRHGQKDKNSCPCLAPGSCPLVFLHFYIDMHACKYKWFYVREHTYASRQVE